MVREHCPYHLTSLKLVYKLAKNRQMDRHSRREKRNICQAMSLSRVGNFLWHLYPLLKYFSASRHQYSSEIKNTATSTSSAGQHTVGSTRGQRKRYEQSLSGSQDDEESFTRRDDIVGLEQRTGQAVRIALATGYWMGSPKQAELLDAHFK